ncbi:unnamed protein product [Orchesella dallaii]|uniref:Uncharacterized protein n=1 Tax=Orchesella dallaii TaxID=48710 RepID=A0ABP1RAM5_9HEXA
MAENRTEVFEHMTQMQKNKELFVRISGEASIPQIKDELIEICDGMRFYVHLDTQLRENYLPAQLIPTLLDLVTTRFNTLNPKVGKFSLSFQLQIDYIKELQNAWLDQPSLGFFKYSKMTKEERSELEKQYQQRSRAAIEWKITFDALKAEWEREKGPLYVELKYCLQLLKNLRAGLESNPENGKCHSGTKK